MTLYISSSHIKLIQKEERKKKKIKSYIKCKKNIVKATPSLSPISSLDDKYNILFFYVDSTD